ncbi:MAG: WYL domain-containing protein [Lachnospiraceae bacterium]|nr:WYL domain-containing protein [Lachnospiraceae bacterium]MCM1240744.1 WYL domain-containing protein [Lachnospiraceae bacterium]
MELFSEVYSCYYQVLRHLLCSQDALTIQDIRRRICSEGFEESLLSIIPRLEDGTWNLFERNGNLYRSRLSSAFITPVSDLERSYLKALLSDPRMRLFLEQEQLDGLSRMLASSEPLWKPEQFYYFDRFADGDPYEDENYRSCFRTLLQAQKQNRYVDIDYTSPHGNRVHHHYVPARLEYSVKNDKFRLLALQPAHVSRKRDGRFDEQTDIKMKLEILNVSRIQSVRLLEKTLSVPVDLNAMIRRSYYKEPLRLRIVNKRNALERAMLHFANYEKNTTKIDEDTYECLIYYNQSMETELLIEVMSFGPMLTVLGNKRFLDNLKARLQRQMNIVSSSVDS